MPVESVYSTLDSLDSECFFGSVLFSCSSSLQEVLSLSWQLDEMIASGDAWLSSYGEDSSQIAMLRTNFPLALTFFFGCTWLQCFCCSSFLQSSSLRSLQRDRHGEGEEQLVTSHDVISQGCRRTSALPTTTSVILLSGVVYWRASQVNDEVIYPMFPQGSLKCNYPLRLCSPCLLFLYLPALRCSMKNSLKRSKNRGEEEKKKKKSVSGHCITKTPPHCFTQIHTHLYQTVTRA